MAILEPQKANQFLRTVKRVRRSLGNVRDNANEECCYETCSYLEIAEYKCWVSVNEINSLKKRKKTVSKMTGNVCGKRDETSSKTKQIPKTRFGRVEESTDNVEFETLWKLYQKQVLRNDIKDDKLSTRNKKASFSNYAVNLCNVIIFSIKKKRGDVSLCERISCW